MAPFAALLRNIFQISISEARTIVSEYFPVHEELSGSEVIDMASQAATDLFFLCPAQFFSQVTRRCLFVPNGIFVEDLLRYSLRKLNLIIKNGNE